MASRRIAFFALLAILAATGCRPEVLKINGSYKGYAQTEAADGTAGETAVEAKLVSARSGLELTISASGASAPSWSYRLSSKLVLDDGAGHSLPLSRESDTCLASAGRADSGKPFARVCYSEGTILLEADSLAASGIRALISLSRFDPVDIPLPETPATYSVDQLVQLAVKHGFASRIEYERVLEARATAENAWLGLVPHFDAADALNLVSMNFVTMMKSAGDLVPFLLPDRWFRAKGAQFASAAEQDGYQLMLADAALTVESLSLSVVREDQSLARLQADRDGVAKLRDEIIDREHSGLAQAGTADQVTAVLNQIDQSSLLIGEARRRELQALAAACGFASAEAVVGVNAPDLPAIAASNPVTTEQWKQFAVTRSIELRQLDDLVAQARELSKDRLFEWLDPAGDSNGAIGAGAESYLEIGRERIEELTLRREQSRNQLLAEVDDATASGDEALQAAKLSQQGSELQDRIIGRLEADLRSGLAVTLSDFVTAFQAQAQADVGQVQASIAYAASRARIRRLTLSDEYLKLITP